MHRAGGDLGQAAGSGCAPDPCWGALTVPPPRTSLSVSCILWQRIENIKFTIFSISQNCPLDSALLGLRVSAGVLTPVARKR